MCHVTICFWNTSTNGSSDLWVGATESIQVPIVMVVVGGAASEVKGINITLQVSESWTLWTDREGCREEELTAT
jgi:hypothetical protein